MAMYAIRLSAFMTTIMLVVGCGVLPQKETFDLAVEVYDQRGMPLAGAMITSAMHQRVNTNTQGRAVLFFQHPGNYTLSITAPYTVTKQIEIQIPSGDVNTIDVRLPNLYLANIDGRL